MQIVYKPAYLKLFESNELVNRVEKAKKLLTDCLLCPHNCGIDRTNPLGFCGASDKILVSSYGPHYGEEAPLVGINGSGTIFFGYCNMRCVFCQNCELSFGGEGKIVSSQDLAEIMMELQEHYHCHNINLVTPTHFIPQILETVLFAVKKGLSIPLVYNCGGYESIESLALLEDVIDIYMPDFKYLNTEKAHKYSKVKDYPLRVKESLIEMDRQVGGLKIDEKGIAYQGLIIRHLIMPGGIKDTKEILKYIKENLSPQCAVNLMDQYYPVHKSYKYKEISRRITPDEYAQVVEYAKELGIRLI